MDRIEELRQQYYESIKLLQYEEDIIVALPQPEFDNFFPIIKGIIELLEKEIFEVEQELKEISSLESEMLEYIKEELKILLFKKTICITLLEKGQEDKTIEEEAQKTPNKNIIFATTESGNICIENDLKNIPEEYYYEVEDSLRKLQEGFLETNIEKGKQLKSTNKIVGLHEIIHFKVRVTYRILSNDTIYVLMAKMKKSTWDARDRKETIDRATQRNKQYKRLKKEIKDPIKKEELIQEHKKTLDRLLGHLEHNKR